jgi:hypothetical protein
VICGNAWSGAGKVKTSQGCGTHFQWNTAEKYVSKLLKKEVPVDLAVIVKVTVSFCVVRLPHCSLSRFITCLSIHFLSFSVHSSRSCSQGNNISHEITPGIPLPCDQCAEDIIGPCFRCIHCPFYNLCLRCSMKPKKDPPIRKRKARRATSKKKKKKSKRKLIGDEGGDETEEADEEEEEEDNGEPIPFFSSLPECQKHSNTAHIFKIIFPVSS